MDLHFLLKGLILGASVGAPIGPIGALCIKRALTTKPISGLVSQLGAATIDLLYAYAAAFGLVGIVSIATSLFLPLRLVGIGVLLYVGVKTLSALPQVSYGQLSPKSLWKDYLSTALLTITNPITIFTFTAMFAALNLAGSSLVAIGVFAGSASWGVAIWVATIYFRSKVTDRTILWISRISGIVIIALSALSLIGLVRG